MRPLSLPLIALLLGMVGCSPPVNRDRLLEEIRKRDPAFDSVLEKHRELTDRIETSKRELALKRSTVERSIAQMRKDLAATTASVNGRIAEIKKRIEPDRQRLRLALSMASEELRAKRLQRASLGRSLAQLKKALKSDGAGWTPEEQARQEARVHELLADMTRVDQETAALREHVRLLKVKLLLIKL